MIVDESVLVRPWRLQDDPDDFDEDDLDEEDDDHDLDDEDEDGDEEDEEIWQVANGDFPLKVRWRLTSRTELPRLTPNLPAQLAGMTRPAASRRHGT